MWVGKQPALQATRRPSQGMHKTFCLAKSAAACHSRANNETTKLNIAGRLNPTFGRGAVGGSPNSHLEAASIFRHGGRAMGLNLVP